MSVVKMLTENKCDTDLGQRWECMLLLRMMLLLLPAYISDGIFQVFLGLCTLLASLAIHQSSQPFINDRVNTLETFALVTNILVLFAGLMFAAGQQSDFTSDFLTWLGSVCIGLMFRRCAFVISSELQSKQQAKAEGTSETFEKREEQQDKLFNDAREQR